MITTFEKEFKVLSATLYNPEAMFKDLNNRSLKIFKNIVEAYVETGDPVGSKVLCDRLDFQLSPATVRNVMYQLEQMGLLFSPHTSAGRLPTEAGLRFFVDGLLEVGNLSKTEKRKIEADCHINGKNMNKILEDAIVNLTGLSKCAGFVAAPKTESKLHHVEFVKMSAHRLLVILVTDDGQVENRIIDVTTPFSRHQLMEISDYLNTLVEGKSINEARQFIQQAFKDNKDKIDAITQKLIEAGLGCWSQSDAESFILLHGQSNLLDDISMAQDIERLRHLFEMLETKKSLLGLLETTQSASGVQIFIGSDNHLFQQSGCSMIVAPYHGKDHQVVGAIGLIGPTRINYGKIIPMVDYTAHVISQLLK